MVVPNVSNLRAALPSDSRVRSTIKGTLLFLLVFTLYVAFFAMGLAGSHWWFKLLMGLLTGLSFSVLFVIGHDACHDSLTSSGVLNSILARICFLPSLHPYCTWELGHNRLHHGWTNLKGTDYVYTPLSKAEYDALPAPRRFMERIYRTVWGAGLFYLVEIWWHHLIWPPKHERIKLTKATYLFDISLITGFFIAEWAVVFLASHALSVPEKVFSFFFLIMVPFLFWNWLMAFVTLQHHTHPKVAWFASKEEWNFYNGQVRGTVHVTLPRPLELMFQNILEHTAHHVDPKIPLYKLPQCQKNLEHKFKDDIIIQDGSLFQFASNLKLCRLYDYQRHQWLDFDGKPTTPPIFPASIQPSKMQSHADSHCVA
jgi:omega-6 fatty acid desaturase (delta-12 desaturase)